MTHRAEEPAQGRHEAGGGVGEALAQEGFEVAPLVPVEDPPQPAGFAISAPIGHPAGAHPEGQPDKGAKGEQVRGTAGHPGMLPCGTAEVPLPRSPTDRRTDRALVLAAMLLGCLLLWPQLGTLGHGLWGPEDPWTHRDFLGAWWLWWSRCQPGDALARQGFPDAPLPLQHSIPNPFDAWLLGPLACAEGTLAPGAFRLWNASQLAHHLLNLGGAALLARALGAGAWASLGGVALVAASPVMLHEIAGGRSLSGAVWPGLFALVALLRGWGLLAGLLLGLQGLAYLYAGALFGLVALILRPSWALLAAALPLAPYALWLAPLAGGLHGKAPPAGFTQLPLDGLLGGAGVPERFRLHPLLLLPGLLGLGLGKGKGRLRRLAAALVVLGVALGPTRASACTSPPSPRRWPA